jgi:DNA repair protein RecO (recombination protein O)
MLQTTKGIVLHSIKHGESAIIANIYTEDFGRQSFLSFGARKKSGKANIYLFHPLSLIEIEVDYRENRNIQRIIEARYAQIFGQIYCDIRRSTIALFLGEILYRNIRESEPNKQLFDFIYNAVQLLDLAGKGVENFHLIFLMQLTKFLGFYQSKGLESEVSQEVQTEFHKLIDISLTEMDTLNFSNILRNKLLENIINIYEQHLTGTGQIQSFKILREVFN